MKIKLLSTALLFSLFSFSQLDKNLSNQQLITFEEIESQPRYPGGVNELRSFVVSNFEMPEIEEGGTILISFVIDTDGNMTDFKTVKDLGNNSGQAVIEALKKAKKWKPGEHKGLPAKVKMEFPLRIESN